MSDPHFRQDIERCSVQSSRDELYPRPDLVVLSKFLTSAAGRRSTDACSSSMSTSDEEAASEFAVVQTIRTGERTTFGPTSNDAARFVEHALDSEPSLVFLRGFASPEWLIAVGDKFNVSPELFRRHLNYKPFTSGLRDFYALPALPSSSVRVFQLTVPTICTRTRSGFGAVPEDLQRARKQEAEALDQYFLHLRARARVTDSVVRDSVLLSKREYVIEQTISVEICTVGQSWCAVIWLDNGKDLAHSVEGPWLPTYGSLPWETYFAPVITSETSVQDPSADVEDSAAVPRTPPRRSKPGPAEWRARQNACLLPFRYGLGADKSIAQADALYALSELLRFAACAEAQYLNLVHARIASELSFIGAKDMGHCHTVLLLNLKYMKGRLASHVHSLANTTTMLSNRNYSGWPCLVDCAEKEKVATFLSADYAHLLEKAKSLMKECDQGMETLAALSVLEESRRSTTMADEVRRLTILATIFIPLSFVCSFWGMNFQELGTGTLSIWAWPISIAGISVLVSLGYGWTALHRLLARARQSKKPLSARLSF